MEKKTQLAILIENNTGELGRVFKLIAAARVNIEAITLDDGIHHGILKMVVDRPEAARKALKRAKLRFSEHDVVAVVLPNVPGGLAKLCKKLAKKKVNISYIYGSTCKCCQESGCKRKHKGDGKCGCVCILSLDDAKTVKSLLR
jgi:hypothetical protein